MLAPRLEQNLSKDEILYLYLNQIYLGHLRYGVEEASRFYFGKGVKDLTLGEAATLAGVIQSPMRWSPVNHPEASKRRQQYVLRRMRRGGLRSPRPSSRPRSTGPSSPTRPAPDPAGAWYADAVRKHLDEKYGAERVETDGLVVQVAMDPAPAALRRAGAGGRAARGRPAPGLARAAHPPRAGAAPGGPAALARAAGERRPSAGRGARLGPGPRRPGEHRARRRRPRRTSPGWPGPARWRRATTTRGWW